MFKRKKTTQPSEMQDLPKGGVQGRATSFNVPDMASASKFQLRTVSTNQAVLMKDRKETLGAKSARTRDLSASKQIVQKRTRDLSNNKQMVQLSKGKKKSMTKGFLDDNVSDMDDEAMSRDDDFETNFDMDLKVRNTNTNDFAMIGAEFQVEHVLHQFEFPKPLYDSAIKIGEVQNKTKLQQICEQIGINESEVMWYNSNQSIKVQIDQLLYNESFEIFEPKNSSRAVSFSDKNTTRGKSLSIAEPSNLDSVLKAKHPKALMTQNYLYLFSLKSKQDELDHAHHDCRNEEDVAQERLDKLANDAQVQVMDVQKYYLMDFEFMQRLQNESKTFVLQAYNKTTKTLEKNPQIQIQCKRDETFFILTHLIEKYLPLKWQAFFEEALKIKAPDCYQFHCYLLKKNSYGMKQPRFFVISQVFMFNTDCGFNPKTNEIEFNGLQWQIPIQAILKIVISEKEEKKIKMSITIDGNVQNQILTHFGYKKVTKTERSVEFAIKQKTTARDFLWHLKRIHHWWNCCSEEKQRKPALDVIIAK